MSRLTGRMRVRVGWRGVVVLQVEECLPMTGYGYRAIAPPMAGHEDKRPTHMVWRDARQTDLAALLPPTLVAG